MIGSVFVLLGAGYETTATTLNWTFYQIAKDQQLQDSFHPSEWFGGRETVPQGRLVQHCDIRPVITSVQSICTKQRFLKSWENHSLMV